MSGKSPRSCGTFKVNFPRSWPSGSGTTSTWIVLSRSSPEIGLPFSSTSFSGRLSSHFTPVVGSKRPNPVRLPPAASGSQRSRLRWALLLASPAENAECRVHGGPVLERVAHLPDDDFEGRERGDHVGLGESPHHPPTPHLPGHLALSTGDHDAMLVAQLGQHRFVVEAVRRHNAGDGDRMHAVAREDLHPKRLDGLMKRVGVACVTPPDVPGPFPFVKVDRDVERKSD